MQEPVAAGPSEAVQAFTPSVTVTVPVGCAWTAVVSNYSPPASLEGNWLVIARGAGTGSGSFDYQVQPRDLTSGFRTAVVFVNLSGGMGSNFTVTQFGLGIAPGSAGSATLSAAPPAPQPAPRKRGR